MSKWKRSGACACDPQYQPKVTCTPMWCVYVCWQGAGDPDNAFIMFFHHEINHAPMAFSRTKFSRRRRRYIRLVARDVDRFARLISAPADTSTCESLLLEFTIKQINYKIAEYLDTCTMFCVRQHNMHSR